MKTAFITGATSGIGKATAELFAKNKIRLVICGRRKERLEELKTNLSKLTQVTTLQFDVSKREEVKNAIASIPEEFKKIDILINNAGVIRDRSFLKMTRKEWDVVMSVNVDSLFITAKAVVPHMKAANYGRIISASSINAYQGAFGQANYCASKAAIVGFTHSLCKEVGKYNITVNAVAPGFIKSEMSDSMPDEVIKAGIAMIPVKRIGTPEDMGYAYLFLASKEAGFVSGHTLHANGGSMPS